MVNGNNCTIFFLSIGWFILTYFNQTVEVELPSGADTSQPTKAGFEPTSKA